MFIEPWVQHLIELDASLTMAYTRQHQSRKGGQGALIRRSEIYSRQKQKHLHSIVLYLSLIQSNTVFYFN